MTKRTIGKSGPAIDNRQVRARTMEDEGARAKTDPATRAAFTMLSKMEPAALLSLTDSARQAAHNAVEQELGLLYEPLANSQANAQHFYSNSVIPIDMMIGSLDLIVDKKQANYIRTEIYGLLGKASERVDISALTPQVIANMRTAYQQTKSISAQGEWEQTYATLRQPGDIALFDADMLLRNHLQKIAAQAALKILGIVYQERSPDVPPR